LSAISNHNTHCLILHSQPGLSHSNKLNNNSHTGKERESDLPDESASRAPVVELFDPLQPIGPPLCKKACDGWVLGLLQGPDFEVAHAFATPHQQPLWIRQKAAEEEAEIQMLFKNRDVQNPVKAGIRRTIS